MLKFVVCSLCSMSDTPGFVNFAAKANTYDDSTERCGLDNGFNLTCFNGVGVRLAADTYDGQASDEQVGGNEDVISE